MSLIRPNGNDAVVVQAAGAEILGEAPTRAGRPIS
jgi:hypothetical protein